MACELRFRRRALADLDALNQKDRIRILKKLEWFAAQSDPLSFAHRLRNSALGQYRFRIGDWRVVVDTNEAQTILTVMRVGHRKEIYR